MAWTFKIYPSIGIARLGNSPNDGPSDFYIGPEIPGAIIVPTNGYKDPQGRVRRQAARFRIYGWEDGVFMGEITSAAADITWTVALANTKGALRNASVSNRSTLMITRVRGRSGWPAKRSSIPASFWAAPRFRWARSK